MTCREVVEALVDYYAEEGAPELARAIEEHLAECPPCLAVTRTYGATIRLTRAAFEQVAGPEVEEALTRRVMERIRKGA